MSHFILSIIDIDNVDSKVEALIDFVPIPVYNFFNFLINFNIMK